jgi:hypothetical protein
MELLMALRDGFSVFDFPRWCRYLVATSWIGDGVAMTVDVLFTI